MARTPTRPPLVQEPVLEFLEEWSVENLEEIQPSAISTSTKVFVNGRRGLLHLMPRSVCAKRWLQTRAAAIVRR